MVVVVVAGGGGGGASGAGVCTGVKNRDYL